MAVAMIGPKFYAWDRNGKPLAFGKLYTYEARTNIPKPTYQSEDQVVENTNPVILNGEGYANVYLSGSYKMVLKDKNENEIWSSDPVSSNLADEWVNCIVATYLSPTEFKVVGNFTDTYTTGRKVRLDSNSLEFDYATIVSSSYSAGETTITVDDAVVKTGIEKVCMSVVGFNSSFNYTDLSGVSFYTFESVDKMISGETISGSIISHKEGVFYSTGGTSWEVVTDEGVDLGGGLFAKARSKICVDDFSLNANDTDDDTQKLQSVIDLGGSIYFTKEKYTFLSGLILTKTVIIDLSNAELINASGDTGVSLFNINNQENVIIRDGKLTVKTNGKLINGNAKKLLIENVEFERGELAIQLQGTYEDNVYDVVVRDCSHDGLNSGGGFFSVDAGNQIVIEGCNGKGGSEFIDFNNLCSYVRVSACVSENYSQNHWDINATRNAVFTGNTIISTIDTSSRAVWVSSYTGSDFPAGAPERLKYSDNVIFDSNTFIFDGYSYPEAILFNSGVGDLPDRILQFIFSNNIVDCRDQFYSPSVFKFGVSPNLSAFDISDNKFINCGIEVDGDSCSVDGNKFQNTLTDQVKQALNCRIQKSIVSNNQFSNLTGQVASSSTGGVIVTESGRTTYSGNNFSTDVDCYAVITCIEADGVNYFIENRFSNVCTDVDGVRNNSGDVVVYTP